MSGSFIIFVIIGIIFSIISKSKEVKQQNHKPMPPFNNKPNTTSFEQYPKLKVEPRKSTTTFKSLEDFAKEVFDQLNEKTNQPKDVFTGPQYKEVVVQPKAEPVTTAVKVEPTNPKNIVNKRPTLDENRSSKNTNRSIQKDPIQQNEIGSYIPTSKQAMVQAIIASEIIGPPKAKQR
ncbi:putative protein OS=Ureibacillus acetophenoni OX=614649 GN=SAMN05877842_102249 PE=4 SV=1 [Ureibacillus acetophenoni]